MAHPAPNPAPTNPWPTLPSGPPYVLPGDLGPIQTFNAQASREHFLQWNAIPVPFIGSPSASVVLLNLNTGFDPNDLVQQQNPLVRQVLLNSLSHGAAAYPFFFLDPVLDGRLGPPLGPHGGYKWWNHRLRELVEAVGAKPGRAITGRQCLAAEVLCVEWFPYPSMRFSAKNPALQSQQYGFSLVNAAIGRGATVVVMRARNLWEASVPALVGYPNLFSLNSRQSA